MNEKQKAVLVVGIVAFIIVGVWCLGFQSDPPWVGTRDIGQSMAADKLIQLVGCWAMVVVPTAGLFFLFKSNKPKGDA